MPYWSVTKRILRSKPALWVMALMCLIPAALLTALLPTAMRHSTLKAPGASLLLLDRQGRFLSQIPGAEKAGYGFWSLESLPPRVVSATLALEDRRFWHHPGVDPLAILRALWQNLSRGKRISGASTITMQVARMQNPGPRNYLRKGAEALSALVMTLRYGRREILKHYLKIVPYGNQSHGIAHAARVYLDKPVADLSWAEIAFLAAIPRSPGRMNPYTYKGWSRAIKRGKRILKTLYQKRLLSEAEFSLAESQISGLAFPRQNGRPANALHAVLKLSAMLGRDAAQKNLRHGPRIFTTLDLDLQDHVATLTSESLRRWQNQGATHGAVIVLQRERNQVLSWLGSQDYFSPEAGAIDFLLTKRSPGSALKPFVFAHALERGTITPGTILDDLRTVSGGTRNADLRYFGPMLPRQALANSRNVPALNLTKRLGIDETYILFRNLRLHDQDLPASHYGPGMALGNLPVSLESLARAYSVLAGNGLLTDLAWFRHQTSEKPQRIFSETTARLITLFLSDPMARLPSFPRMGTTEYPFPVAVKTGTSRGYRDAWCVAYSKNYLVGALICRADHKPMQKLSGAGSSAYLAQKILLFLHRHEASGTADLSFPKPKGYKAIEICALTGKKRAANCEHVFQEWFPAQQIPADDTSHQTFTVDIRNQLIAGPWTPNDKAAGITCVNLPARYSAWAAENKRLSPPTAFSPLGMPANAPYSRRRFPGKTYALRGENPIKLSITSPENGMRLMRNPNIPAQMNSLALRVAAEPAVLQVLWYVNGKSYKLVRPPFEVRWPLAAGTHSFQARIPFRNEASRIVRITVE